MKQDGMCHVMTKNDLMNSVYTCKINLLGITVVSFHLLYKELNFLIVHKSVFFCKFFLRNQAGSTPAMELLVFKQCMEFLITYGLTIATIMSD